MTTTNTEPEPHDLTLAPGGPAHQLAKRVGLARPTPARRLLKVLVLMLVTWAPLLVLSWAAGHAQGDSVKTPFLYDPEVHGRLLFALPMLELGSLVVAGSLALQMRHLWEMGILPESDRSRFRAAQTEVVQLRDSFFAEIALVVLSFAVPLGVRLNLVLSANASSWDCVGGVVTRAGWWYLLVSLPILYFFLLRRVWVFLIWGWFLLRISRLDLQLTSTHPDHAGGLGFIGQGLASFVFLVLAISAIVSAGLADQILNGGESLNSLKYHVALFIGLALAIVHLPLLAFAGRLSRCRTLGLLEFGALAWRHDRAFDEKWIKSSGKDRGESLLGNPDVQSLAEVAACYDHVEQMWLIPLNSKASVVLVLAALVPMLPLVGTAIPLQDILLSLGKLLI